MDKNDLVLHSLCNCDEEKLMVCRAVDLLLDSIDMNGVVKFDSSPDSTLCHPSFKAILAMGVPALDHLFKTIEKSKSWTSIMAIDGILDSIGIRIPIEHEHHGKIDELCADFSRWWSNGANGQKCLVCNMVFKERAEKCPVCHAADWPAK